MLKTIRDQGVPQHRSCSSVVALIERQFVARQGSQLSSAALKAFGPVIENLKDPENYDELARMSSEHLQSVLRSIERLLG